jgi:hypothetical protein
MEDNISISAKNLGHVDMPDFCPRCFWLKVKMNGGMPFQVFPGIFSSIDSYTKKITRYYYEQHQIVPPWMKSLHYEKPVKIPPINTFSVLHEKTGITIRGVPDEIFLKTDGSYAIADYKTARFTEAADNLMPIYRVQLNTYAYIAEKIGLKPITNLALIYYDPSVPINAAVIDDRVEKNAMLMPFATHIFNLDIDSNLVDNALQKVKQILSSKTIPESAENCKECPKVAHLISLAK